MTESLKNVGNVMVRTNVVRPGMIVRDMFEECGRCHVQALPFVNDAGELSGCVTIKGVLKNSCLPEFMVEMAPLLGEQMSCVENAEAKAGEVLCMQIDPYVGELRSTLSPDAPLIKALAMMVRNDTSYLFVVEDGAYLGIITISAIAASMTRITACEIEPVPKAG